MAEVMTRLGFTKNVGNFENVRVDTEFTDTVRDGETVEEAQARIYEVVETELIKRLNEVVEEFEDVTGE